MLFILSNVLRSLNCKPGCSFTGISLSLSNPCDNLLSNSPDTITWGLRCGEDGGDNGGDNGGDVDGNPEVLLPVSPIIPATLSLHKSPYSLPGCI